VVSLKKEKEKGRTRERDAVYRSYLVVASLVVAALVCLEVGIEVVVVVVVLLVIAVVVELLGVAVLLLVVHVLEALRGINLYKW